MRKISTGQDSTLKTYRQIAFVMDGFMEGKATNFVKQKIAESPNGENEEVIKEEEQVIHLLLSIARS